MTPRFVAFEHRPEATRRLICFPFAGGAASAYRDWARLVPPDVELAACQLPGRHERFLEPLPGTVDELIERLAGDYVAEDDGRPAVFFGHSFGALVAFLLAAWLQDRGRTVPTRLGLSARPAPQTARPVDWHRLPDDELLDVLGSLGGLPPEVAACRELRDIVLPPLRCDLRLSDGYALPPRNRLKVPQVDLFTATDDTLVPDGSLDAWGELFAAPVSLHLFTGGHFYLWPETAPLLDLLCSSENEGGRPPSDPVPRCARRVFHHRGGERSLLDSSPDLPEGVVA